MFRRLFRSKFKYINSKYKTKYLVINNNGEKLKGVSNLSYEELKEEMISKGYYIIKIKNNIFNRNNQLKEVDLFYIFSNLDFLLNSSIGLIESIDIIINTTDKDCIKESLKDLKINISKGFSFSKAVNNNIYKYPHIIFANLRAGELTGSLDKVCRDINKYYERKITIKSRLRKELRYPAILLIASFLLLLFLFIFFLPIIEDMYIDNCIKITILNSILFRLSYYLRTYFLKLFILLIILSCALYKFKNSIRNFMFSLLGSKLMRLKYIELISNLKLLLYSGINFHEALLELSLIFENDKTVKCFLEDLILSISRGSSILNSIKKYNLGYTIETFIKIGEETGDLSIAIDRIHSYIFKKINNNIDKFISYLEPSILFFISIFIIIILLSITKPIFDFLDNIL